MYKEIYCMFYWPFIWKYAVCQSRLLRCEYCTARGKISVGSAENIFNSCVPYKQTVFSSQRLKPLIIIIVVLIMNVINSIKAIIILQIDGKRVLSKYYDENLAQKQFEKKLYDRAKTPKAKDEIIVVDDVLVLHKFITDTHVFVAGGRDENPLVLDSVLNCLAEVIMKFESTERLSGNTVLNNLSRVIMALDEICEGGIIMETDPDIVSKRIPTPGDDSIESITQSARKIFGF